MPLHHTADSILRIAPRCLIAMAFGAWLLALTGPSPTAADSGTAVTRLQPGDNLIGWIGPPTSFSDLFASVPEVLVVFTWDVRQQRYRIASPRLPERFWTMRELTPNFSYLIRIVSTSPVDWQRPDRPVRGLVRLQSGVNWVAWAGPDDWTVTEVARGIGNSLTSIRLGDHEYRADQPDTDVAWPLIQRGDPLIVTVSRDVQWLQPAGLAPELVFLGNVSPRAQRQAQDDLQSMMDFFLTQFGIQPDGSEFSIVIARTFESLIEYEEDRSGKLDESRVSELRTLWDGAFAWSGDDIVIVEPSYSCTNCAGRYTFTHEVFHKLQGQLQQNNNSSPAWMVEGAANWAHSTHGLLDRHRRYTSILSDIKRSAAKAPRLQSAERRYRAWQYSLGHLAALTLEEATGADAHIEYLRLLAPTGIGPKGRWPSFLPWQEAFAAAFGDSVEDFYRSFGETQDSLPGRVGVRRQSNERVLKGTIVRADDSPVGRVWVTATQLDKQGIVKLVDRALSDETGSFEFFVPHSSDYRIGVELGSARWCHVWHADDGATKTPTGSALVRVSTRSVTSVNVVVPDQVCTHRISGRAFAPDGAPLGGINVSVSEVDRQSSASTTTFAASDGTFDVQVPGPGAYRVSVDLGGCWVFYQSDGVALNADRASSVNVLDEDVGGVRIEIPEQICQFQIGGVLVDGEGAPLPNVSVFIFSDSYDATSWTDQDGAFAITVPRPGRYRLQAFIDSCHVFYGRTRVITRLASAHRINVTDRDRWGFDIRLREGMCEQTIAGVLQDADGKGVANGWIVAFSGFAEAAVFSGPDGSFTLRVPTNGRYRLLTHVDDCSVYHSDQGAITEIARASRLRVSDNDLTGVLFQLPSSDSGLCG